MQTIDSQTMQTIDENLKKMNIKIYKRQLNFRYWILMVTSLSLAACGRNAADDELAHHHHDHAEGEAEYQSEINLSEEAAAMFGLTTETVEPGDFHEIISVSGQIVDSPSNTWVVSAPTNGIVHYGAGVALGNDVKAGTTIARISSQGLTGGNANEVARVEMQAAKAELERLEPLYAERIISAATYNEAKANYEKAKAAYSDSAASGIASTPKSGVITQVLVSEGQNVEVGEPLAVISDARQLTLRADLPEKYYSVAPMISTAIIQMPYCNESHPLTELNGKRTTNATATGQLKGYMPIYFTFDNDGHVMPGSYVKVNLQGAVRTGVITVPVEAVSEQQGKFFVYRQIDEDCYEKLPVELGQNDGVRVEVKSGLQPGQNIVVKGATAVRLAESSGAVPEGHSHSH